MADVFISYSSSDRATVRKLVGLLEKSWDIWWDDTAVGRYRKEIEQEIEIAKCIVSVWSGSARESDNVFNELDLAKKASKTVIPVRLEVCEPPFGHRDWSNVDLFGWTGDDSHHGVVQLTKKIQKVVSPTKPPRRPTSIVKGKIGLPVIFQSVSSHETRLEPSDALKALRTFGTANVLVSAYDLVARTRKVEARRNVTRFHSEITRLRKQGGVILLDSGNYEATRLDDSNWNESHFHKALKNTPHDLALSFDVLNPSSSPEKSVKQIVASVRRSMMYTDASILPIVHSPKRTEGGYNLSGLPAVVRDIAVCLHPPMIAIPERELGPGLLASAKVVREIRSELNKLHFYQPIHLLGTGNPWSVSVYSAAGADSFDGLEWCRQAVDRTRGRLHHVQHFDFFAYQARFASSQVARDALDDERVGLAGKIAFHNLDFYADFNAKLRQATSDGKLEAFVAKWLEKENTEQLATELPELFR